MTQHHISLSAIADHILEVRILDSSAMKHMESCTECRSDFQWLKVLRNLGETAPPESAVETAARVFKDDAA